MNPKKAPAAQVAYAEKAAVLKAANAAKVKAASLGACLFSCGLATIVA